MLAFELCLCVTNDVEDRALLMECKAFSTESKAVLTACRAFFTKMQGSFFFRGFWSQ